MRFCKSILIIILILSSCVIYSQAVVKRVDNLILINIDETSGYKIDDIVNIYRNDNGKNIKIGTAKIIKYRNFQCGAKVIKEKSIIKTGDFVKLHNVNRNENVQIPDPINTKIQNINFPVTSVTITNSISEKQLYEYSETNAAESVGRLTGVYLKRNGPEANKIIIRGMTPNYTLIQINGITIPATSEEDRSIDISMITSDMFQEIELSKSFMANQDANAIGGIVNFKLKKASEKSSCNVVVQGGMNDLRNSYQNYKITADINKRFFSNKLGIFAQADYKRKDIGSQQLSGVVFSMENTDGPVRTNSMQLMDVFEKVNNMNSSLVMDYSLKSTEIKLSNYFGRNNHEETNYGNLYDYSGQGFSLLYEDLPKKTLTIFMNSLQFIHSGNNWEISSTLSHSYTENMLPARITVDSKNSSIIPFASYRTSNFNVDLDPESIPDSLKIPIDEAVKYMNIGDMYHEESKTNERDLATELNLSYKFYLSKRITLKINLGGKYKHKNKTYDKTALYSGSQAFKNLIYNNFEDELSDRTKQAWNSYNMDLLLFDFLDQDYDGSNFFNGRYNLGYIFDKEKFRRIHDLAMSEYNHNNSADMLKNFIESNYFDFYGTEGNNAFYLMPEINVDSFIYFSPGVRYESFWTNYTGYSGNRLGILRDFTATPIDTISKSRNNEFMLPMIHTLINPTKWLTIKIGYTNTVQQPDFKFITPGWLMNSNGYISKWGNFHLKPEHSKNLDIQFTFNTHKLGFFSVGAFHKKISDKIYWTGARVITDTTFFELPSRMQNQRIEYATNISEDVYNYGFEAEWNTNFYIFPECLNGLFLNANYTYNKSEVPYPRSLIKYKLNPGTPMFIWFNDDTTCSNPMIYQPDHLVNLMVGYHFKEFTIRFAMKYRSKMFISPNWYDSLWEYSTDYYNYDMQIQQKLPINGLDVYFNIYNLTNEMRRNVINHLNLTNSLENYGRIAYLGFRYQL